MFSVGDRVIWERSKSNWSRISTERVQGEVIAILPHRVRIRLLSGIKNSLTALVDPNRLRHSA